MSGWLLDEPGALSSGFAGTFGVSGLSGAPGVVG